MSQICTGNKGDHLRVDFGFYKHHGIDLGDGDVIHFGRGLHDLVNAKIEVVSKSAFANGRRIEWVNSPVNFSANEIVLRAQSRVDEQNYDLFHNNCEHFVHWCRSGVNSCRQIESTETVVRQAAAIASKPVARKIFATRITNLAGNKLAMKLTTRATGVAIVGDATQAAAELIATSLGKPQIEARRIGLGTGAVTSAALGTVVGGPVVGVTTLGVWVVGQVIADRTIEQGKRVFTSLVGQTHKHASKRRRRSL